MGKGCGETGHSKREIKATITIQKRLSALLKSKTNANEGYSEMLFFYLSNWPGSQQCSDWFWCGWGCQGRLWDPLLGEARLVPPLPGAHLATSVKLTERQ